MATTNLVTAAKNDFLVYQGDTTPAALTFTATIGGAPIDLTGYVAKMEIKTKVGGELIETFSTVSGDIAIGGTGHNVLTITGWERLEHGSFVYDLELDSGGNVTTYLVGKIKVTQDITA